MPSRPVSSSQFTANRRNAQKSTGPRSRAGKARVSRNAWRHGRYAGSGGYGRLVNATMEDLGEDPGEFSRLEQALIDEWQPQGLSQTLLVEDLASLRWERQRLERARAALVARRVQELELKRQRASLQVEQQTTEQMPAGYLQIGLLWVTPDSATKFQKLLEYLNNLKLLVATGVFAGAENLLGFIYGQVQTPRGILIRALFGQLAQEQAAAGRNASRSASRRQSTRPPAAVKDEAGPAADPPAEPDPPAPDPTKLFQLRRELEAEICNVTQCYQLYIREHVEVTPVMRSECLAPTADQRWLMREQNMVDRQLEKKMRLLWAMRHWQAPPDDESDETGETPDHGGSPGRRSNGRPDDKTSAIEPSGKADPAGGDSENVGGQSPGIDDHSREACPPRKRGSGNPTRRSPLARGRRLISGHLKYRITVIPAKLVLRESRGAGIQFFGSPLARGRRLPGPNLLTDQPSPAAEERPPFGSAQD